jgi:lauroyl/myristoyl acyltransferase
MELRLLPSDSTFYCLGMDALLIWVGCPFPARSRLSNTFGCCVGRFFSDLLWSKPNVFGNL